MSKFNTPIKIGKLEVKNRLVMPPMATAKASETGAVTQALCDYYDEKSSGGYIGLVITEHLFVSVEGKAGKGQLSIATDEDISGLERLTRIIHKNGSKVMAQISHAGGAAKKEITGKTVMGASSVEMPRTKTQPVEMDRQDILKVIEDFAAAALRAQQAGFDGVEIHSAHGYLLNQFYSPLTNKRTDEYNADTLSSRLKLHTEIIKRVRNLVGQDYPIAVRLGACDYIEGGSTLCDGVEAATILEQAGVDLLDISGGFCGYIRPGAREQGYFSELTEPIKKATAIPVILTGGITDATVAEALLLENKADLIGVGRAILKDSLWAKQAIAISAM
ncbi:MAG: NADH:flavin oxidoreductase [Clostridia bacterium]|nr:NADH:flavin oxidoreductase [Clostridia bacterium]